ncbi:MAG: hypothetical protein KKF48_01605 [Nanoarchaeota archaeon]|nr:hypothetical protein [Nanoarchaeota archaeon]MBU1027716.1 hypothetical protein [Nanoarchaeota archaeon]
MKKVVLDTSFILSCVREKFDFIEELDFRGYTILIPKQVFAELGGILKSKQKLHFRDEARIALKILENIGGNFEEIDLGIKNVDNGLIKFSEKNKDIVMATMDKELKNKIKNNKIVLRGKKKLEVV